MATFTLCHGDILKERNCEAIVNTVNCVGVAGIGLALQFKERFGDNHISYVHACREGFIQLGEPFIFAQNGPHKLRYIVNFPTKGHYRENSHIENIIKGLQRLNEQIRELDIKSIAIPKLGCNYGRLKWKDVRPQIIAHLGDIEDLKVVLYE